MEWLREKNITTLKQRKDLNLGNVLMSFDIHMKGDLDMIMTVTDYCTLQITFRTFFFIPKF